MQFSFENDYTRIEFVEQDGKVFIKKLTFFGIDYVNLEKGCALSNVFTMGENCGDGFARYSKSLIEFNFLDYRIERQDDKQLLYIREKNDRLEVTTIFTLYDKNAVLLCEKEVKNVCQEKVALVSVNILNLTNVMTYDINVDDNCGAKNIPEFNYECQSLMCEVKSREESFGLPYLWKAHNTWCHEGAFERIDLNTEGLRECDRFKRCGKVSVVSNGSQQTCRYLPLGILEREPYGYFMFEMTTSGGWSYEIEAGRGDVNDNEIVLALSGKNLYDNGWCKTLQPGEVYQSEQAKLLGAKSLDGLAEHFTLIRRRIRTKFSVKPYNYVIYNNFQQNTYDHPTAELDKTFIDEVVKYGTDYYVVDAGWHDDSDNQISPTQKVGEWEENVASYPNGFIEIADLARSKGMKFGFWVELQSIGIFCKNKNILPEECFFHVQGIRTVQNRRYQLDFSKEKSREFATGIIDKVVKKYSPEYIKIDYNQTSYGNESETGTLSEGLEKHVRAYNKWFVEIQAKYPNILFESCASGGMNLEPNKVQNTNVFSITDAGWYYGYPYVLANICMATLPEQNGIWNMPMRKLIYPTNRFNKDFITTDEEVIMNVINSLYGVMHLASRIDKLSPSQQDLLKEGINYYRSLAKIKENAIPIFPNGFTLADDSVVYLGIKTDEKIYLSVYNMSNREVNIAKDLSRYGVESVALMFPSGAKNKFKLWNQVFECQIGPMSARAFELNIKK